MIINHVSYICPPRFNTVPDENVATPHRNACTIEGAVRDALLNGDTENYTGDNGYTIHSITKDNSKGITVQFNQPYLVNCIRMLLWDKDNRLTPPPVHVL